MQNFQLVAFDGDDTLWENEALYRSARARFMALLSKYTHAEDVAQRVHEIEIRNLKYYGYGVAGFIFSLIEAGIVISDGKFSGSDILSMIDISKEMLAGEVRLLGHAQETLAMLAKKFPLVLITKGDLRHQQFKIDQSGLRQYFHGLEIVSDKNVATYAAILEKHAIQPGQFLMVGNSLRSDILPVIELGGWAVYIPHSLTWAHETIEIEPGCCERMTEIESLSLLPAWLESL